MGCDHQCRRSPPEWRHQGRQRASAAPLPVRPEPGRTLAEVRPRRRARDEPRTADEAAASRSSSWMPRSSRRCRVSPSPPPNSSAASRRSHDDRCPRHHQKGLVQRSGGEVVPGMRGLFDPDRNAAADARDRVSARGHRLHFRHRLCRPVPVLHEHVRDALDPWTFASDRHRLAWLARISTCGSSAATATRCRSVATI